MRCFVIITGICIGAILGIWLILWATEDDQWPRHKPSRPGTTAKGDE